MIKTLKNNNKINYNNLQKRKYYSNTIKTNKSIKNNKYKHNKKTTKYIKSNKNKKSKKINKNYSGGFFTLFRRKKLRNKLIHKILKYCNKNSDNNCNYKLKEAVSKFNYKYRNDKNSTTFINDLIDLSNRVRNTPNFNKKYIKIEVNNIINNNIDEVRGLSNLGASLLAAYAFT
jgi:hypothetical protein